jgi:hypothetical protein
MFWKALLLIAPAGLALGMVGGHLAKPVMTQRVGDEPWQAMFQSRADRDGRAAEPPPMVEGPLTYTGGYSYAPDFARDTIAWAPPDYEHYRDIPLPDLPQLDARQAALLADPEVQFGGSQAPVPAEQAGEAPFPAAAAGVAADLGQVAVAAEPRTPDGSLPAIW